VFGAVAAFVIRPPGSTGFPRTDTADTPTP
jgi:hypothetical protein